MTTNLETVYIRSTESSPPKIILKMKFPVLLLFRALFFGDLLTVELTENQIDSLSHLISRWRLVSKFKTMIQNHHSK